MDLSKINSFSMIRTLNNSIEFHEYFSGTNTISKQNSSNFCSYGYGSNDECAVLRRSFVDWKEFYVYTCWNYRMMILSWCWPLSRKIIFTNHSNRFKIINVEYVSDDCIIQSMRCSLIWFRIRIDIAFIVDDVTSSNGLLRMFTEFVKTIMHARPIPSDIVRHWYNVNNRDQWWMFIFSSIYFQIRSAKNKETLFCIVWRKQS